MTWINKNDEMPDKGQRVRIRLKNGDEYYATYHGYDGHHMWRVDVRIKCAPSSPVVEWRPIDDGVEIIDGVPHMDGVPIGNIHRMTGGEA